MPPLRLPRVLYLVHPHASHPFAARAYRRALSNLGVLTESAADAEVVVFHAEMRMLSRMRQLVPGLAHKHQVALLVWEVDRLREADQAGVRAVDEIWTPTLFSARALVPVHRRVYLLPHVVEPPGAIAPADAAVVAGWLAHSRPTLDVLAIMPTDEPRKNLAALVAAVRRLRRRHPSLRLVVKAPGSKEVVLERSPDLLIVRGHVSQGLLEALLARAHVVASAHRAEAWGLTLSDALRRGIPLVCTDFGGQRAFAAADGAYLVKSVSAAVGPHAASLPFDASARWAEPCAEDLEQQLCRALDAVQHVTHAGRAAAGLAAVRRYDQQRLQLLLRGRLADIGRQLPSPRA